MGKLGVVVSVRIQPRRVQQSLLPEVHTAFGSFGFGRFRSVERDTLAIMIRTIPVRIMLAFRRSVSFSASSLAHESTIQSAVTVHRYPQVYTASAIETHPRTRSPSRTREEIRPSRRNDGSECAFVSGRMPLGAHGVMVVVVRSGMDRVPLDWVTLDTSSRRSNPLPTSTVRGRVDDRPWTVTTSNQFFLFVTKTTPTTFPEPLWSEVKSLLG